MIYIDRAIFINQLAQGIKPLTEGVDWFIGLSLNYKAELLHETVPMIAQGGMVLSDVNTAITKIGIKPTKTACVMLLSGNLKVQLAKLPSLPEPELKSAFIMLVSLLGVVDERKRKEKPLDLINHWWHRDLTDEGVLSILEIRIKVDDVGGLDIYIS